MKDLSNDFIFKSDIKELAVNMVECDDILNSILIIYFQRTILSTATDFNELNKINKYFILIRKIICAMYEEGNSVINIDEEEVVILSTSINYAFLDLMKVISKALNEPFREQKEKIACIDIFQKIKRLNLLIKKIM